MSPLRTCIGCGKVRPQQELVRLRLAGGALAAGKGPGRGAYLCGPACGAEAARKKAFGRAFRGRVKAPEAEEIARLIDSAQRKD